MLGKCKKIWISYSRTLKRKCIKQKINMELKPESTDIYNSISINFDSPRIATIYNTTG